MLMFYHIELKYPVKLGNNLVLTPHTYRMSSAAHLTDTLFLNAEGNPNAVFVLQINGALTSGTYAQVTLTNGAQAKNVYWKIEGAVTLNNYSTFSGTIICNNGSLGALNTGVVLNGRSLTTAGAITTTAITATANPIPGNCGTVSVSTLDGINETVEIYPNPFRNSITVTTKNSAENMDCRLSIYNVMGVEIRNVAITNERTTIEMMDLPAGIYLYKVLSNGQITQSGKLIAQP